MGLYRCDSVLPNPIRPIATRPIMPMLLRQEAGRRTAQSDRRSIFDDPIV